MKKLWIVSLLLIVVAFIAAYLWILPQRFISGQAGQNQIAKPKSLDHLPLIGLRQSGTGMVGRLESPVIIDGYPCDAGWVHFDQAGRLKAFYLSDTSMIQGNQIPKGTWIQLNPDLTVRFCSFPENTNIQGHLCDGGVGGSEGVTTSFYPSGRLSEFYSPRDVEIQGIPCRTSPVNGISLHENGNLKEFTLSRDTAIGGQNLSAGDHVILDEQGSVRSVTSPSIVGRAVGWVTGLFR